MFVFILLFFWIYFLSFSSFFFNSSLSFHSLVMDEASLYMIYMMVFVLFTSYIYALYLSTFTTDTVFIFMLLFCVLVFSSNNLFILYLSYESSLLPILFIIVKWGSYPERSLSAMMLLAYTAVFTFPFIYVMFYLLHHFGTLHFFLFTSLPSFLFSLIIFLTFAVKLPIYGLHFWLPMAHVEAPTFGSMILAGILLKLGGVGLLRLSGIFNFGLLSEVLLAYTFIFLVYTSVVCMFQSDFKRLVAYSSVSHMMAIPILVLSNNYFSFKVIIMLMLFHGLSSPVLFMLVGVLYSIFSTRQLVAIRGLLVMSPLISFMLMVAFFFTISAPPFPSFISEVFFIVGSLQLSFFIIPFLLLFIFFSMVYNLNWLSSMVFGSSVDVVKTMNFTYLSFFPLALSFIYAFVLVVVFTLF